MIGKRAEQSEAKRALAKRKRKRKRKRTRSEREAEAKRSERVFYYRRETNQLSFLLPCKSSLPLGQIHRQRRPRRRPSPRTPRRLHQKIRALRLVRKPRNRPDRQRRQCDQEMHGVWESDAGGFEAQVGHVYFEESAAREHKASFEVSRKRASGSEAGGVLVRVTNQLSFALAPRSLPRPRPRPRSPS